VLAKYNILVGNKYTYPNGFHPISFFKNVKRITQNKYVPIPARVYIIYYRNTSREPE